MFSEYMSFYALATALERTQFALEGSPLSLDHVLSNYPHPFLSTY